MRDNRVLFISLGRKAAPNPKGVVPMSTITHEVANGFCVQCGETAEWLRGNGETVVDADATAAAAAEFIATEVAHNGHATVAWMQRKLATAGHDVPAADIAEFGVQAGLLQAVPRMGGYVASANVNAREFGQAFADWMRA